jgi:diguanylate cyclase (GGDEF)-like protein
MKGGWRNPSEPSQLNFIYPVFPIPENLDTARPVYIAIDTPYTIQFGAILYTSEHFKQNGLVLFLIIGICIGILVSMFLYNLFLYYSVRERRYLYYVFYVLVQLVYQSVLFGLVNYLWPVTGRFLFLYVTILSSLMMFSVLLFTMNFLNTKVTAPVHHRALTILSLILGVIVILTLMNYRWIANISAYITAQAGLITVLTASLASMKYGFKPARYFFAANVVFFICGSFFIFRIYNIVPNNQFTMHAVFFGSAAESILLSFALGYRIKVMKEEESRLRESEKNLHAMSVTDELTGLYNKRFFNSSIDGYIQKSVQEDIPVSLLMLDVDHFKRFNDTYGHPEGDTVLANLGAVIRSSLRDMDLPCRYGGEEFAVILYNADSGIAMMTAERIRMRFEEKTVEPEPGREVSVTVSIGVSQYINGETKNELIRRCDHALYRAKDAGRNRVVLE